MQAPSPRDSLLVGPPPRCHTCGQLVAPVNPSSLHPVVGAGSTPVAPHRRTSERFIKPAVPVVQPQPQQPASPMDTSMNKD